MLKISFFLFCYSNDNKNSAFQDPYNQTHSFTTDSVKLNIDIDQLSGWPGQWLELPLKALNELGNPSGSLTHFSFIPSKFNSHELVCKSLDMFIVEL